MTHEDNRLSDSHWSNASADSDAMAIAVERCRDSLLISEFFLDFSDEERSNLTVRLDRDRKILVVDCGYVFNSISVQMQIYGRIRVAVKSNIDLLQVATHLEIQWSYGAGAERLSLHDSVIRP